MNEAIKKFVQERNAVLLSGDVNACISFLMKHNPNIKQPTFEVAEIMMHKSITAATNLPREYRVKSYQWLKERNMRSFDDGDLG